MQKFGRLAAGLAMLAVSLNAAPQVDKAKLEAYIRYAEGFMANVHFVIDDPVASPFPNFYRLAVHLSTESGAKLDRIYFMTPDGQEIVNGSVWDLHKSPFEDTLAHLPHTGFSFGPEDAKVHLVIFSDFECPYCREFAKTVRDNIPQKYPKDVRVTFEDFPLTAIHPWAEAAAEASHCIGDDNQDKFWAFHDWIFAHAGEIKAADLQTKILAWATEQKLDAAQLKTCMDTHAKAEEVKQSEAAGKLLGVQQTPTGFMNGRPVAGALNWAGLDSVIEVELKRPAGVP